MMYMLDTNIIVYAQNHRPKTVIEKLKKYPIEQLCLSAITLAELEYGVCNSSRPELNRLALMRFLARIEVVPFDGNAAREYGRIRFELKKKGTPIGGNDLLIGAHAKALGLTLITNNTKEFKRIKGLKIENWA